MSFLLSLSIPLEVNFHNKHINLHSATLSISATTSLVGTLSKGHLGHSILEFTLLKSFAVNVHPPKPSLIKRVDWVLRGMEPSNAILMD
ncbi:hypothetical protein JHK82_035762 [Glycine max]|uniref:Uncharacterized protein n=1 Tax=Glycine max TaxID=3847 RepID=A0A0R0GSC4_SOYBN|nr:hypothetical protein JHK85_036487 [Glycine max]KAG4976421.1 hypothetical protein JHK86_035895 [Glycine max]KAG5112493.1 hypothetical protein JHK82_035762 [Glycine max]KAG5129769.1 hypothetical protein JHK84_036166 [Glycine max]KAH1100572.1 hypothetical protein GYH30_035625 [Glycine max]